MRLRKGLKLREVAGVYMLVPDGAEGVDFNDVFTLSESAAWLWKSLQGIDFDEEDALRLILSEYDVDVITARSDLENLIGLWRESGMLDE